MSICFVLVLDVSFIDILIAPWLSTKMRIGAVLDCGSVIPKILLSEMASFTAEDSAMYSASEDDWATQPCFLDFQLIAPPAITKTKAACRLAVYLASSPVRITKSNRIYAGRGRIIGCRRSSFRVDSEALVLQQPRANESGCSTY